VLKDNGHTVLRVVRTDRNGETVEEERPAGTLADTNNLTVFAPDGTEITNYMKSQADNNQSPVDNNTNETPTAPSENKTEGNENDRIGKTVNRTELHEGDRIILINNNGEHLKRMNLLHESVDEVLEIIAVGNGIAAKVFGVNERPFIIAYDDEIPYASDYPKALIIGKVSTDQSEEGSQEGEVNKESSEEQIINNWINNPQIVETIKQYCVGVSSVEEAVQKML